MIDGKKKSILVIRRDNIGDLLCTTPLLKELRERFPTANISVLVNSYNAPVIQGNPDVDDIFVYEKAKHRDKSRSIFVWIFGRLTLLYKIRRRYFDYVILATPNLSDAALKFSRHARAAKIVGYGLSADDRRFISLPENKLKGHECEMVFSLLTALGITTAPPAMRLVPDSRLVEMLNAGEGANGLCLGVHISARKPQQRWAVEKFANTIQTLIDSGRVAKVLVFWAPGREDDPLHPGDDGKAETLSAMLSSQSVKFISTSSLEQLIAAISLCDRVVCADGGAMHIAAALGKPIVCFFGNSDAERWHPWGVPFELLQKPTRTVADISSDEVISAWDRLDARLRQGGQK